ncbi:MAG: acyltransferase family protein [Bacteroidia bacterium]
MSNSRRYDIDWLRVISIGLLLIYHIAIVFQPWAMFIAFIKSNESLQGLWTAMTFLNVWRIPFLFYVSGMGVFFALRSRNLKQLIIERSKRILLPFVFGFFAIVPLHYFLFQEHYNLPMSYKPDIGHLWFLGNIFVYVLVLAPLFIYLKNNEDSRFMKGVKSVVSNPFGLMILTFILVIEALLLSPQIFTMYARSWHGFFIGFGAFFLGFLFVLCGDSFWNTVKKWKWMYFALAASLYTVRAIVFNTESPSYLMSIESNIWILSLFGFGYVYLNKPSKYLSYLSKAAYPVYIIHMFVLYGVSMLVLSLDVSVYFKFPLVVVFTFIICFLIYEFIISRIGFLRPLFGLNYNAKKPVPVVESEPDNKITIESAISRFSH